MYKFFRKKGFPIIISAPSGTGKSTIIKYILKHMEYIKLSISTTTRLKRSEEIEGIDYFFKTSAEFNKLIEKNIFLEYAKIYNNYYGSSKIDINNMLNNGYDVLFDIDWQGARNVRKEFPNNISIFIMPPSIEELEKRLKLRNQDSEEVIKSRMNEAHDYISHLEEYEYVIVNNHIDETSNSVISIIKSERMKLSHLEFNITEN